MGADMVTMTLPLPLGRQPDWEAAASAVRNVRLEVLWDTGDLYDWETWLDGTGNLPGAVTAFTALRAAQAELHKDASFLRGAIEHGWPNELIELEIPSHLVWVTGGPSWGEAPGDLIGPMIRLGESGVMDAIGFDSYTRYDGPPIPRRRFGFPAHERRLTRFGEVAAQIANEAAGMQQPPDDATAGMRVEALLAELDALHAPDCDGKPLLRFAARALALSTWLLHPSEPVVPAWFEGGAMNLAEIADEGGVFDAPRRRSLGVVARELRRQVYELLPRFELLDDPASPEDDDPFSLDVQVSAFPLFTAVAALVDLYGDVGPLLDAPPPPIASPAPGKSSVWLVPLAQYLSLVVAGDVDWKAAKVAIEQVPADERDERRADLMELRRVIARGEYRRFACSSKVGSHRLFLAAPHDDPAWPDLAPGIGRLGHDGVLDAAGVVYWSAPGVAGPGES